MTEQAHVLITGGAGYIGSFLTGELLRLGWRVTVVDDLLFGGESLLAFRTHPGFKLVKADVWDSHVIIRSVGSDEAVPKAIIHLAGIDGFPACQAVGRQVAWRYNVEATEHVFEQAVEMGVSRFIYLSTYSIYGISQDEKLSSEEMPPNPQSLFAETKVASERYLQEHVSEYCAPLIFRSAHLYGLSPRPRFDIIVNQFVLDAFSRRELLIYQRGYLRSFVHISDLVNGILLGLQAEDEKVRGQIYNLGSDSGNLTKDDVVSLVLKRLPETHVIYKDLSFGGDMRDIRVSFRKIQSTLNFQANRTVDDGIREILDALRFGIIRTPQDQRYRNAQFIVR
jgi:nucleoside-diphosphate-sugar epimerase